MKAALDDFYDAGFYAQHVPGMTRSSKVVLTHLYSFFRPESVVDFGCGRGAWLASASELGSSTLKGFDGKWIDPNSLLSKKINFTPVDLSQELPSLDQKFDLCISLEVAEHIPQSKAKMFVDKLCSAADIVLFSAAIKLQGGTNHINEQNQSYWIALFKENGYECYDAIRPAIWNDTQVEWWYKQNALLFCREQTSAIDTQALKQAEKRITDIVHPETLAERTQQIARQTNYPTLTFCLGLLKRWALNKLGIKPTQATQSSIALLLTNLVSENIALSELLATTVSSI